jgi:ubiquinone biosynthesis accessory factor UbiJ
MLEPLVVPSMNHVLRGNAWALERLAPLAGKTVRIECVPFVLALQIRDGGELAPAPADTAPDATIRVSPGAMLRLVANDENAWTEIDIAGDTDLATAVNQVWRNVRWDFEEDLARVFGDIAAHRMAETGRTLKRWGTQSADNLARSLAEYWTEEDPLIARRRDVEQFNAEVDRFRDDVARLEKRIARLG